DESFVAGKKSVPSGQQIPFQPTLAEVLAQDFDDATLMGNVLVGAEDFAHKRAFSGLEDTAGAIRFRLVRPENAEVFLGGISFDDVAQKRAKNARGFAGRRAGLSDLEGVITKIGDAQVLEENAAVGARIGAHAPVTFGGGGGQVR